MRAFSRLFAFVVVLLGPNASARLPETKSEESLLYWRYLCRNEPQKERVDSKFRELSCPEQGWVVRADPESGKVREVLQ